MHETIRSLQEVDDFFGVSTPMPAIHVEPRKPNLLDFIAPDPGEERDRAAGYSTELERASGDRVRRIQGQFRQTWRSLRRGGRPETVLHALILRDDMTVPRLAAILMQDITEVEDVLDDLVSAAVARSSVDADGVTSYSLAGLATEDEG